jgi:hypothetical protein
MLHACAQRFDVMGNLEKISKFWELNKALVMTLADGAQYRDILRPCLVPKIFEVLTL